MSSWPANSHHHPGDMPSPKIPPPQGFFEQLLFTNASFFPVDELTYWLDDGSTVWMYNVIPAVLPNLMPSEIHIDQQNQVGANYLALEAHIVCGGTPYQMQPYVLKAPGHHILRVAMGLGASVQGPQPRPYCAVHAWDATNPAQIEVEVVPAPHWL